MTSQTGSLFIEQHMILKATLLKMTPHLFLLEKRRRKIVTTTPLFKLPEIFGFRGNLQL